MAEDEEVMCGRCDGRGIAGGKQCPDCGGRGRRRRIAKKPEPQLNIDDPDDSPPG